MVASASRAISQRYRCDAVVYWSSLRPDDHKWDDRHCLYAYLAPETKEVLYIGKAWGVSVRGRWRRYAKERFWNDLERYRRIRSHCVLHGEIILPPGRCLGHKLLTDIESLLICGIKPWGNIQSRHSRRYRPGYVVACYGSWPHQAELFVDAG